MNSRIMQKIMQDGEYLCVKVEFVWERGESYVKWTQNKALTNKQGAREKKNKGVL